MYGQQPMQTDTINADHSRNSAVSLFWIVVACNIGFLVLFIASILSLFIELDIISNLLSSYGFVLVLSFLCIALVCAIIYLALNRKSSRPHRSSGMIMTIRILLAIDILVPVILVGVVLLLMIAYQPNYSTR